MYIGDDNYKKGTPVPSDKRTSQHKTVNSKTSLNEKTDNRNQDIAIKHTVSENNNSELDCSFMKNIQIDEFTRASLSGLMANVAKKYNQHFSRYYVRNMEGRFTNKDWNLLLQLSREKNTLPVCFILATIYGCEGKWQGRIDPKENGNGFFISRNSVLDSQLGIYFDSIQRFVYGLPTAFMGITIVANPDIMKKYNYIDQIDTKTKTVNESMADIIAKNDTFCFKVRKDSLRQWVKEKLNIENVIPTELIKNSPMYSHLGLVLTHKIGLMTQESKQFIDTVKDVRARLLAFSIIYAAVYQGTYDDYAQVFKKVCVPSASVDELASGFIQAGGYLKSRTVNAIAYLKKVFRGSK